MCWSPPWSCENLRTDILFYLSLHNQLVDLIGARYSVAEGMQHFKLTIGWIIFSLAFLCYSFFPLSVAHFIILYLQLGTEVPMHISRLCSCFYMFLQPWWPCPVFSETWILNTLLVQMQRPPLSILLWPWLVWLSGLGTSLWTKG